jgi:hypothetical protein
MLTTIVAFGNILTNKLRKEGNMQKQWARIDGSPQQLKKTRRYLEDRVSTFVLSNKKTQYVEVPRVELKWLSDVIKNCNAQWRKVEDPGHFLALCGQWTTSVVKHQIACRQCRKVKLGQEPEQVNVHGVMATHVAPSETEQSTNETLTTGATENTLGVLQTLIQTASEHKDEYMAFASKWERYQNALVEVCDEIVSSAHRLREAKAEYEASANRVAKLLDVENV